MRSNMGRAACYFVSLSAVTQATLQSRRGEGFSCRDNSSQVNLMEDRKVLHSACAGAAAGCDDGTPQQQRTVHNSLSRTAASVECAQDQALSDLPVIAADYYFSRARWSEVTASGCLQQSLVGGEIVNYFSNKLLYVNFFLI